MLYPNEVKMPVPLQEMYDTLTGVLDKINGNEPPSIGRSARLLEAAYGAMEQLRAYVIGHPFAGQAEEIFFFKQAKPLFYRQFLFYRELYFMDVHAPEGGCKAARQFYKKKLRGIREYFDEHRALYEYMRRDATFRDELYFLRQPPVPAVAEAGLPDLDRQFSTAKDFEVAEILKNELLQKHLDLLLETSIAKGNAAHPLREGSQPAFQWTATLSGLYELIYSLRRAGAINNGNVTISQLVEFFEAFFGVNLKNIYRGHQDNRIKQNRSAFLKLLVKKLEEDMDETDENPRGR